MARCRARRPAGRAGHRLRGAGGAGRAADDDAGRLAAADHDLLDTTGEVPDDAADPVADERAANPGAAEQSPVGDGLRDAADVGAGHRRIDLDVLQGTAAVAGADESAHPAGAGGEVGDRTGDRDVLDAAVHDGREPAAGGVGRRTHDVAGEVEVPDRTGPQHPEDQGKAQGADGEASAVEGACEGDDADGVGDGHRDGPGEADVGGDVAWQQAQVGGTTDDDRSLVEAVESHRWAGLDPADVGHAAAGAQGEVVAAGGARVGWTTLVDELLLPRLRQVRSRSARVRRLASRAEGQQSGADHE
jgi:hypothetical protein